MGNLRKVFLPILITGIWINISEAVRWIFLIKSYWIKHYQTMNLAFPNKPINGIMWIIWGFIFAAIIFILSKKYSLIQTTFLSWFIVFVMTWIVLWNAGMLPTGILVFVVPLSLFETYIGVLISNKLSK